MTSTGRYSTGSRVLDSRLDGGIPPGTLVALVADPASQSEVLVEAFGRPQPATVVSTTCASRDEAVERFGAPDAGAPGVDHVHDDAGALLAEDATPFEGVAERSYVVVDPTNDLEHASRTAYGRFLHRLRGVLRETASVGLLHALTEATPPAHRWLTLKRADHVWTLEMDTESETVRYRLLATKSRGDPPLTQVIPLVVDDGVRVDTSSSY